MAEIDPAQDDGQLELKKRARRRLVGAVALALAAVIVLPMVMDQEPKPLNQDIQIRIPSKDADLPRTPAVAEPKPATVPAAPEAVKPMESAKPVDSGKPPAAEPKPEIKAEPKAELPKAASLSKTAAPAKAAPPAESAKAPAAEAKPESKPESKHDAVREASHEQWILQLGAYQDPANVRLLLAKLKELGYPSYTEKVDTEQGPRTRVRGGPFASRNAAEKAQAKLKKIGAGGPPGGIVVQKQ